MNKFIYYSLDNVIRFGKHQGSSLNMIIETDPGYLVWCLENINRLCFSFDLIKEIKDKYPVFLGIDLLDQHGFRPTHEDDRDKYYDQYDNYYYGEHYVEFGGTYVLDVEGLRDRMLYYALDGEPDAYWNID